MASSGYILSLPFTFKQCQQLLALLLSSKTVVAPTSSNLTSDIPSHSMINMAGKVFEPFTCHFNFVNGCLISKWIVDTKATDHMVSSVSMLTSITVEEWATTAKVSYAL